MTFRLGEKFQADPVRFGPVIGALYGAAVTLAVTWGEMSDRTDYTSLRNVAIRLASGCVTNQGVNWKH